MEWKKLGLCLMRWLLLPDSLRPFKIYCASPSITSQLVQFLWQTVEIDPLGHVRVVEALQNFVQMRPRDIVRDSHSHSTCSTVHLVRVIKSRRFRWAG